MKEIDIQKIIMDNFHDRMTDVKYKEYPSIYDALHSSEYRKVAQRNFGAICEGFKVAELTFSYKNIPMHVVFEVKFDFEYAERKQYSWGVKSGLPSEYPCGKKFSVKPKLGIDEIQIKLDELDVINKTAYKLFDDNIPFGGGKLNGQFIYHSIAGMHCEGHQFELSHVKFDKRIVDFFNYLFGMTDKAIEYKLHPELKPKIVEFENTSWNDYDDFYDCDYDDFYDCDYDQFGDYRM